MFNWSCRSSGLILVLFIFCLVVVSAALWEKTISHMLYCPFCLSSSKTNKDVKHQSCSWLIKDLKYFPLCLTWFWVSPFTGTTTGQNKLTFFCVLLLHSLCVKEVNQTKPEPALWCHELSLFKGSLSLTLSLSVLFSDKREHTIDTHWDVCTQELTHKNPPHSPPLHTLLSPDCPLPHSWLWFRGFPG